MNKKISILMICFIAFVAGLSFTSCSSDDDEKVSKIVGTWCFDDEEDDDDDANYVMCKDGTLYLYYDNGDFVEVMKATYTYDEETGVFKFQPLNDDDDYQSYKITFVTDNEITLTEIGDGHEITLTRIKSTYSQAELEKMYQQYLKDSQEED